MEAYVNFTQHALNFFGVVQLRGAEKKTNNFLSSLVIVTSITLIIQIFAHLVFNKDSLDEKLIGFTLSMARTQELSKLIALVSNRKKIRQSFDKLEEMFRDSNEECKKASDNFMEKMFRINLGMIKFYIFTGLLFLLKPIIVMSLVYFKTGEIVQTTPYPFWYPYEKVSYAYYLTYLFEIYVGMVIMTFPFATDQLFLLLVAFASNQFKSVGSSLLQAIKEKKENVIIKEEIKKFAETHNELIEICNFFSRMYSIPLFIHILTSTFIICLVEFMIVVSCNQKVFIRT